MTIFWKQHVAHYFPEWVVGLLLVSSIVLLIAALLGAKKRFFPRLCETTYNDLTNYLFTRIGVLYSIFMGFMIVVAWQMFDLASTHVSQEANAIASLFQLSKGMDPSIDQKVTENLKAYVYSIIHEEWPDLSQGKRNDHTQDLQSTLWNLYDNYNLKEEREKVFLEKALHALDELSYYRRLRIMDAHQGLDTFFWTIILVGGALTLLTTLFFYSPRFWMQVTVTSLFFGLLGLVIFALLVFQYPYSGRIKVEPTALNTMYTTLWGAS